MLSSRLKNITKIPKFSITFQKSLASSLNKSDMNDITSDYLKEKLSKNLKIEHLDIIDESNCNCGLKFNVLIVSDDFVGKPRIQRHRMVHSILEEELKLIHAFSQKTLTVEQWKKGDS